MNDQFYYSFFIFHKEYLDNKGSKIIGEEDDYINFPKLNLTSLLN